MNEMENLKQRTLSSIHLLAHDKDIIKYLKLKRQYVWKMLSKKNICLMRLRNVKIE